MLIQKMARSECLGTLTGARLGRLACAHGDQPYAVPFYFVYHDPYLYGFTTPGQKTEWMRANPHVCVELDEVDDAEQWMSIILFGQYEELPDAPEWEEERLRAHQLLQKHPVWWEPGCASSAQRVPSQPLTPIFFRIRMDRITGRRARPSDGREVRSRMPSPARDSAGWLRRVLHALCRPFAARRGRERYGPSLDEGRARLRPGAELFFAGRGRSQEARGGVADAPTIRQQDAPVSEADRLYEQYRRELQRLQEACPHEQLTDWVEEWWAPGHGTGREVRACANCNKVVQARRQCHGCSKFFLEGELKQGDGHILPIGSWYCAACHREKAARETGRQGQGG